MLCLRSIVSAVLVLGAPARAPAEPVVAGTEAAAVQPTEQPAEQPAGQSTVLPAEPATPRPAEPAPVSYLVFAPLPEPEPEPAPAPVPVQEPAVRRRVELVRIELVVGPVWRIRITELMSVASVEFGRRRGFSGTVQGGIIVGTDREVVTVTDAPIGAGFVFRHRFRKPSLQASVGLTAGVMVHRARTDRGLVHRVDPDLQLPLRFAWTVGAVGLSVALLQGFSMRTRTYTRRGTEVWQRIPYRIGVAVGVHFDIGVGTGSRRSGRESKGLP